MVNKVKIKILTDGGEINGELYLETNPLCRLVLFIDGEERTEVSGTDFFSCFCTLRELYKDVVFLCKGSKINVYPSRMSRQMANGIKAYQLTLGQQASREDLVNIFDYDDDNLSSSPQEQHDFFQNWISSLG